MSVAAGSYNESVTVPDGICVIGTGAHPWSVLVTAVGNWAFRVVGGPHGVLVENLGLHVRDEFGMCALENHNDHLEVRGCYLDGFGIDAQAVIWTFTDIVVRYCLIGVPPSSWLQLNPIHPGGPVSILAEDCTWGGESIAWGMDVPMGTRFVFKNNTFNCCIVVAPDPGQTAFSMRFINCIDAYSRCWGGGVPDTLEWRYCDFYWPPDPYPNCGTLVNCFSADPLFCDKQHGDFRLEWGSPCIGAGEGGEDVGARFGYCDVPLEVEAGRASGRLGLWVSSPRPNPATGAVEVLFRGVPDLPINAHVIGVDGTLVRVLTLEGSGALQRLVWDGVARDGRAAPTGVYYMRIESGGLSCSRRLIMLR